MERSGTKQLGNMYGLKLPQFVYEKHEDFVNWRLLHESWYSVYRVRCRMTNGLAILKVYNPEVLTNANKRKILEEVRISQKLSSQCPNIVASFDCFEDRRKWLIVFEHCAGGDLFKIAMNNGGTLASSEGWLSAWVVRPLLETLKFLHGNGVVHRDLKPENVYINSEGVCKLGGYFNAVDRKEAVASNYNGTLEYTPPEVLGAQSSAKDKHSRVLYTPKVDIWSLGVLVYDMLLGTEPFYAEDPGETIDQILHRQIEPGEFPVNISEECMDFVMHCLQKSPSDRPDAEDLLTHPWIAGNVNWVPTDDWLSPVIVDFESLDAATDEKSGPPKADTYLDALKKCFTFKPKHSGGEDHRHKRNSVDTSPGGKSDARKSLEAVRRSLEGAAQLRAQEGHESDTGDIESVAIFPAEGVPGPPSEMTPADGPPSQKTTLIRHISNAVGLGRTTRSLDAMSGNVKFNVNGSEVLLVDEAAAPPSTPKAGGRDLARMLSRKQTIKNMVAAVTNEDSDQPVLSRRDALLRSTSVSPAKAQAQGGYRLPYNQPSSGGAPPPQLPPQPSSLAATGRHHSVEFRDPSPSYGGLGGGRGNSLDAPNPANATLRRQMSRRAVSMRVDAAAAEAAAIEAADAVGPSDGSRKMVRRLSLLGDKSRQSFTGSDDGRPTLTGGRPAAPQDSFTNSPPRLPAQPSHAPDAISHRHSESAAMKKVFDDDDDLMHFRRTASTNVFTSPAFNRAPSETSTLPEGWRSSDI